MVESRRKEGVVGLLLVLLVLLLRRKRVAELEREERLVWTCVRARVSPRPLWRHLKRLAIA